MIYTLTSPLGQTVYLSPDQPTYLGRWPDGSLRIDVTMFEGARLVFVADEQGLRYGVPDKEGTSTISQSVGRGNTVDMGGDLALTVGLVMPSYGPTPSHEPAGDVRGHASALQHDLGARALREVATAFGREARVQVGVEASLDWIGNESVESGDLETTDVMLRGLGQHMLLESASDAVPVQALPRFRERTLGAVRERRRRRRGSGNVPSRMNFGFSELQDLEDRIEELTRALEDVYPIRTYEPGKVIDLSAFKAKRSMVPWFDAETSRLTMATASENSVVFEHVDADLGSIEVSIDVVDDELEVAWKVERLPPDQTLFLELEGLAGHGDDDTSRVVTSVSLGMDQDSMLVFMEGDLDFPCQSVVGAGVVGKKLESLWSDAMVALLPLRRRDVGFNTQEFEGLFDESELAAVLLDGVLSPEAGLRRRLDRLEAQGHQQSLHTQVAVWVANSVAGVDSRDVVTLDESFRVTHSALVDWVDTHCGGRMVLLFSEAIMPLLFHLCTRYIRVFGWDDEVAWSLCSRAAAQLLEDCVDGRYSEEAETLYVHACLVVHDIATGLLRERHQTMVRIGLGSRSTFDEALMSAFVGAMESVGDIERRCWRDARMECLDLHDLARREALDLPALHSVINETDQHVMSAFNRAQTDLEPHELRASTLLYAAYWLDGSR